MKIPAQAHKIITVTSMIASAISTCHLKKGQSLWFRAGDLGRRAARASV
jgi:hypothetical protein